MKITCKDWGGAARLALTVAALAVGLAGCHRTTISDIVKNPQKYSGYEVTIAGEVTNGAGEVQQGTFEVDDGTGKLWVVSSQLDIPSPGSHVAVVGLVEDKTDLGSNSLPTVLQEVRRYENGDKSSRGD